MIIERCKRGHDASWRTEKLWRADFGCMACDAEDARAQRDELLTDMRELFAKHSELGPQDDCTCCFGDTCQHCYDRQDNFDKCLEKMRKKWGVK